jgi:hypothetical protein
MKNSKLDKVTAWYGTFCFIGVPLSFIWQGLYYQTPVEFFVGLGCLTILAVFGALAMKMGPLGTFGNIFLPILFLCFGALSHQVHYQAFGTLWLCALALSPALALCTRQS